MNSNLKWLIFILITISSLNASAQSVTLDPDVAQFFRDAYYKGRRDSFLLKNCNSREKDYVTADSVKRQQIASYKRDSVGAHNEVANLHEQKRVSVDSVVVVSNNKLQTVKKRSAIKTWIIIALIGGIVERSLLP